MLRTAPPSKPTHHFEAMFLLPVKAGKREALESLLDVIGEQTARRMRDANAGDGLVAFHRIESLHFARLVLLDDVAKGPLLMLAVDFDGDADNEPEPLAAQRALLKELAGLEGLRQVLDHCDGFDGDLVRYLPHYSYTSPAPFVGTPGRSVRQIRWEAALRERVEAEVYDTNQPARTPAEVRQQVRQSLQADGIQVPSFPPLPNRSSKMQNLMALRWPGALLAMVLLVAPPTFAAVRLGGWTLGWTVMASILLGLQLLAVAVVRRFRWLENHDPQFQPRHDAATHDLREEVAAHEDEFLQNALTKVAIIKRGPLRWLLLRIVLRLIRLHIENVFNRGKLGGIPSIHFARWVIGPNRRLIFISNYDGSWESYLGDFVDKASIGLTAIWSNTELFPRSRWLVEAGSRDADRFLGWVRYHQRKTHVWYSAYPTLSVVDINLNTALRRGLADDTSMDDTSMDDATWLSLLRNVDRLEVDAKYGVDRAENPVLDLSDIQALVLKGYGDKDHARYLLLRVKEDADLHRLRSWLSELPIAAADRETRSHDGDDPLLNVAFTHPGLVALGLERALCDAFSTPFVHGTHHPQRARTLGDLGEDAPSNWHWGSSDNEVHVVLALFARDESGAKTWEAHYEEKAEQLGLSLVYRLEATPMDKGRKEHFGFRDGISQPLVKGGKYPAFGAGVIPPGDVLLGHPNAFGGVSPAPTDSLGRRFGHNGSYMVLRQLEQDVGAFWRYCEAQAQTLDLSAIGVASKMMGRWPSGAPLVRFPDADPGEHATTYDNDFGFVEGGADNDRYGSRCPFGAHIRRANPRDWALGETRAESMQLANQHRIVRRGRPYGARLVPESSGPQALCDAARESLEREEQPLPAGARPVGTRRRGMVFICFNADLERQFEFVQQHWCNNPKFGGLQSEADPVTGMRESAAQDGLTPVFTLQSDVHGGEARQLVELQRFVRVRGGAYLFMPSLSAIRMLPEFSADRSGAALARKYERATPDEPEIIAELEAKVRRLLVQRDLGTLTRRDAHPKLHGLVRATLEVPQDIPEALRRGVFQPGASYSGWVRLSNQEQVPTHDGKPDTRGLALKLDHVEGLKLLEGEEKDPAHDFIFLSTPTFVARDPAEFSRLMDVAVEPGAYHLLRALPAFIRHRRSQKVYQSLLEIDYFSVVPSLLGEHAVKYELRAEPSATRWPRGKKTPDYLRERLVESLAERSYRFELFARRFVDQRTTPVEDPTVLWKSEPERIATLTLHRQDDFDTPERRAEGERMPFNPARCLPEHRPLGGINRARRRIYQATARFRHERNAAQ